MKQLSILLFLIIPFLSFAQIYEAQLIPEGIIFPRVNTAQREALGNLTPGQTVFDTDQQKLFWYENPHGWVSPGVFKEFESGIILLDQRLNNRGNLIFAHQGGQIIDTTNNSGWGNTILGVQAGHKLTTSSSNTFLGHLAGFNQQSGYGNTYIGIGTGLNADSTYLNTFVGIDAGHDLLGGSVNVAIGGEAMFSADHSWGNVAIGTQALKEGKGDLNNNVAIGNRSLNSLPTGWDNVAIGAFAGEHADSIYGAVFIGHRAGFNANTENVFIGNTSGENAKDGYSNTFVGTRSGQNCTTGWGNTLIGAGAGNNIGIGGENTFLGDGAGSSLVGGYGNTLIGQLAGLNLVTGSRNVYLGRQVGTSPDYTTPFSEDNTLRIHNGPDASPLIMGKFDNRTININGAMTVRDFVRLTPTTVPSSPEKGMMYYDASDDKVKVWTGSTWENLFFTASSNSSETNFIGNQGSRNSLCNTSCLDDLKTENKQQDRIIEQQQTQLSQQQTQIDILKNQMERLLASVDKPDKNYSSVHLKTTAYLAQNQPNPFNEYTSVNYFVPANVKEAKIQITNANGAVLEKIDLQEIGEGELTIHTGSYSVGTYYYSLILDGEVFDTKRMVIAK